jgi:hypothetical protein
VAGFDAIRAYQHALGLTILECPNRLEVGVEASFVDIVRMADIVANHRFFATDLTLLGHFQVSLR